MSRWPCSSPHGVLNRHRRAEPAVKPFRFGVNVRTAGSGAEWADKARKVEALGYSVLLVPDHLAELLAPLPALAAAAVATKHLRIGTAVLNNDFRHPVLLAREAATLDVLSDGRFELGLGAGHMLGIRAWARSIRPTASTARGASSSSSACSLREPARSLPALSRDRSPNPSAPHPWPRPRFSAWQRAAHATVALVKPTSRPHGVTFRRGGKSPPFFPTFGVGRRRARALVRERRRSLALAHALGAGDRTDGTPGGDPSWRWVLAPLTPEEILETLRLVGTVDRSWKTPVRRERWALVRRPPSRHGPLEPWSRAARWPLNEGYGMRLSADLAGFNVCSGYTQLFR